MQKRFSLSFAAVLIVALTLGGFAQLAPNAPVDKPVSATASQTSAIEKASAPYVEQSRKTYPDAKARYLAGLPEGNTFYVTARLTDPSGHYEIAFLRVTKIADGRITGVIASEILTVKGHKEGDQFGLAESELLDWTISKPDGSEEGNVVGKFLETYARAPKEPAQITHRWRSQPSTPHRMSQRLEEAAVGVKDKAPIPRMALYDIGYPRDDAEYTRLNGHAVLLVTAVSQNKSELPLRRVYVAAQDREIDLKLLKFTLSDQTGSDNSPVRVFGVYRQDALFLLPVKLRVEPGTLLVDFSDGQSRLQLGTFGPPVHPVIARLALTPVSGSEPSAEPLETFIRREYPGFFQNPGNE